MTAPALSLVDDEDLFANGESPFTAESSFAPTVSEATVFTIIDLAPGPSLGVPAQEWEQIFWYTAADAIPPNAVLAPAAPFTLPSNDHLVWRAYSRSRHFALELARLPRFDNCYGARLISRSSGTVLHYQPETWSTNSFLAFDFAPISSGTPALTAERPVEPVIADDAFRVLANRLEALSSEGDEEEAMSVVFDELEASLRQESFADADALLERLEPARLHPSVTLMVLTLTWHAKEAFQTRALAARKDFVERAALALRSQLGPERAEALLADRR